MDHEPLTVFEPKLKSTPHVQGHKLVDFESHEVKGQRQPENTMSLTPF